MQYLLLSILLYGLSGKHWQVVDAFGFGPFAPSPYCPSPYYVVAPSYQVYAAYPQPNMGFFDTLLQAIFAKKGKPYPPSFSYPAPPLYYPPPPPMYYPPPPQPPSIQDHIIKVHITKDFGDDNEQHHHHHHNHDYEMEDNWN